MAITDKDLENTIVEYAKQDLEQALMVLTGVFVGLNELYIQQRTELHEDAHLKTINLTGGYREITIHPPAK